MRAPDVGARPRWRSPQERIRYRAREALRESAPQLKHLAQARGVDPSQVSRELSGERRGAFEETAVLVWRCTLHGRVQVQGLLQFLREVHIEGLRAIPAAELTQRFRDLELLEALRGIEIPGLLFRMNRLDLREYLDARRNAALNALALVELGEVLVEAGVDPRGTR